LEAALTAGDGPSEARSRALWGAGWFAYHHGDYQRTDELGRELLLVVSDGDHPVRRRNALTLIGNAALAEGRTGMAVATLRDALAHCAESEADWHRATSQLNLGIALLHDGQANEAQALFQSALASYELLNDGYFTARSLVELGYAALALGEPTMAASNVRRAMAMFAELGDAWGIADGLEAVATLRAGSAPVCAAVLVGAAASLRERIGMSPNPADATINDAYVARAREQLTPGEFKRAGTRGRELRTAVAVRLALQPW
jgi:tetratricopeptide (TPR) repeat protein